VRLFVPFSRHRDQFAFTVALGDVGDNKGGQGASGMQLAASLFETTFIGQVAQQALERDTVGVFEVEGAGDLAGANLAGLLADESEKLVFGRDLRAFFAGGLGQGDIGSEEFAPSI